MPTFGLPSIDSDTGVNWDQIELEAAAFGRKIIFPPDGAAAGADQVHGKVEVTCKIGRDLGEHRTSGKNGGRVVDKGLKPAEIKIKLSVWDQKGMDGIVYLMGAFEPRKRIRDRSPIGVYYPSLIQLGITQVIVSSVTGLAPTGVNGMFSMDIDCIEYTPKREENVTHTVRAVQSLEIRARFEGFQTASNIRADSFNRNPADGIQP